MKRISAFIKSARFAEVSILLGFPLIGIFFAFESAEQLVSTPVLFFVLAVFLLFTAIYAFNGLAGMYFCVLFVHQLKNVFRLRRCEL